MKLNKENIKDVVVAEAVEPHPLAEEDGEVADQGHLDDGDLEAYRRNGKSNIASGRPKRFSYKDGATSS